MNTSIDDKKSFNNIFSQKVKKYHGANNVFRKLTGSDYFTNSVVEPTVSTLLIIPWD